MRGLNVILTFAQIAQNSLVIALNRKLSEYKYKCQKNIKLIIRLL